MEADLGDAWPLTVPWVLADCHRIGVRSGVVYAITFVDPHGTRYSADETAEHRTGLPSLHPIWADQPNRPGQKMDLTALLELSITLCR